MFNIKKCGVHIKSKDIYKSFDFYSSLGFKPVFSYGTAEFYSRIIELDSIQTVEEKYNGVVFDVSGMIFEIADGHIAVKDGVFKTEMKNSKISLIVDVDAVNEVVRITKKKKYKISVPVKVYPWGSKEVVIKDPDGVVIVFRELLD
ncbi:VOC family protein [Candidatus Dojkabacteria bacterium]|uniref:VOC family protein n=1 Tax=Candidatus Dojkabacteria bacterium TaxID=2099670 RepID=A0A955I1P9_9BACT|nr:VOC family protein [Candidatus Dojkabacteria bacterium]MCB9790561.1 VOC family protein [Candidatus Nomurabacteria bacterium]